MIDICVHLACNIAGIPIFPPRQDLVVLIAFENCANTGGNFLLARMQSHMIRSFGENKRSAGCARVNFTAAGIIGLILFAERIDDGPPALERRGRGNQRLVGARGAK